jgi:hypothetical protein
MCMDMVVDMFEILTHYILKWLGYTEINFTLDCPRRYRTRNLQKVAQKLYCLGQPVLQNAWLVNKYIRNTCLEHYRNRHREG